MDVSREMTRLLVAMAFNKEEKEARRKRSSILLDRVIGRITGTENQQGINACVQLSLPVKNKEIKCDKGCYVNYTSRIKLFLNFRILLLLSKHNIYT